MNKSMNRNIALCCLAAILVVSCSTTREDRPIRESDYSEPIRVACIGDSITFGLGITDREHNSYPSQLQKLLGQQWAVQNFGTNGTTALKLGIRPYVMQHQFRDALAYEPHVVIIKLGTNDTNPKDWPKHKDEFLSDYREIVRAFRNLRTKPRIYLCAPIPIFRDRGKEYDTDKIMVDEVIPKIREVAKREHLPVIDLYTPFAGKSGLLPDGVHPNAEGARIIAETIYAKLLGKPARSRTGQAGITSLRRKNV